VVQVIKVKSGQTRETMCLCIACLGDIVWRTISVIFCYDHPRGSIIQGMQIVNLFIRLSIMVMSVTLICIEMPSSLTLPGVGIFTYKFSKWKVVADHDWIMGTVPHMQVLFAPGEIGILLLWTVITLAIFINDLCRVGMILRGKWFSIDNHMDVTWGFQSCFPIPLLFVFCALFLGNHDGVVLFLIFILVAISGISACCKDLLRSFINTETTPNMRRTLMLCLQMMHDTPLFTATMITIVPFIVNGMFYSHRITMFHYINAIGTVALYFTLMITQWAYDHRCSLLEIRWPSQRAVIVFDQTPDDDSQQDTVHIGLPLFPPVVKPDCESSDPDKIDPFNVETSEEIYDRIYFGCHQYETCIQKREKEMGITPNAGGSFQTHMETIGGTTRASVGLLCEWRRHYLINIIINILLVTGVLNIAGYKF
jgi:hypothetical protein